MASAQVKKLEHLEAGKKKLEEFRKKKAAEKAKKASSAAQITISDGGPDEKRSSEPGKAQPPDFITGSTPESVGASFPGSSTGLFNHDNNKVESSENSSYSSSFVTRAKDPDSASNTNIDSLVPLHSLSENKELKDNDRLQSTQQIRLNSSQPDQKRTDRAAETAPTVLLSDASIAPRIPDLISDNSSLQSTSDENNRTFLNHDDGLLNDSSGIQSSGSHLLYMNGFPDNSVNVSLDRSRYEDRFATGIASSLNEDFRHFGQRYSNNFPANGHRMDAMESNNTVVADREEVKLSGSSLISGASSLATWSPDNNYNGFNSSIDAQWASTRRSRPSFLDSINFSKGFTSSTLPEPVNNEHVSSKYFPDDSLGSSLLPNATPSTVASLNGVDLHKNSAEKNMEYRQDLYSQKQNDDFAALEQHIEDLTQEKFSLQRALEASRTFADSLAAENSALTNSYNQQGSLVHQLKSESENLQQEIKAKLNELEAVKVENSNAQLECNAADERAKLLASEVIGLEEKALRLKSNELKLQRQLESIEYEISSLKKRISSLEKERRDMHSTIDALQEEKKLLQSMLRKSSTNEKFVNESKASTIKKDVSTTTDDLGYSSDANTSLNMSIGAGNDASNQQDNTQFSLQDMLTTIPADQMRMIENINSLISELALEKEELVQALSVESSQNHNLKELNKELNRKLEVQTQRLELLTAKSMINDVSPARTSSSVSSPLVHEDPTYADEGDEVVERVLGWIMKLFPGGPSRRRNSKVL